MKERVPGKTEVMDLPQGTEEYSCPLLDFLLTDLCVCGHPNFGHKRDSGTDKYSPDTLYKCQEKGCNCAHLYDDE